MYFQLGMEHIADLGAYDHMLYLLAVLATFAPHRLKPALWLITAFTIGHSLTLALAALGWITVNAPVIEFLIPLTIALTAAYNLWKPTAQHSNNLKVNYLLCLGFGLIHGMGFSNYLLSLLGREQDVLVPLLAFNLGLELGQIIIGICIFTLAFLARRIFNCKQRDWVLVVSGAALGLAITMMIETKFW